MNGSFNQIKNRDKIRNQNKFEQELTNTQAIFFGRGYPLRHFTQVNQKSHTQKKTL